MGLNAWYRLDAYPCNFNFFEFLVASRTAGATHIVFDDTRGIKHKYPDEETKKRIASILEPGCALAGMTYSWGKCEEPYIDPGYHFNVVLDAHKKFGRIEYLKSVLPQTPCKATITIRNWRRKDYRNSNEAEWKAVAKDLGAVVIPDYEQAPIHLHERMSLYAGSKMNFFVANGPGILCLCSEYPFALLMGQINEGYHESMRWGPKNPTVPWQKPNQRAFWCQDTKENIARAVEWAKKHESPPD